MTANQAEGTKYQLSVDTGGTFTDGFVTGPNGAAQVKVDTTPADPTEGFAACVSAAADAMGEDLRSFLAKASVVHFSSTIATNVVVQRTGAQVGLIVTSGFEESLYGNEVEADQLRGFVDPGAVRGVSEKTNDDGTVSLSVDPVGLEKAVRELLEWGVHVVVVSFAGAHLNPANEIAAKALIETSYPKHYLGAIPLVLSSQLSLHANDYGRTSLAVANAYLHPVLARSLYRAEDRLREQNFRQPLLVVNTDGSSTRVAKTRAIDTFNSGPSAGVLGSAIVARAIGAKHVVTFDVGGTTTDVAYINDETAPRASTTTFGDLSLPHPSVELWSFGLGGGSVIEANADGHLTVGPRSSGAVPGPACFGLGGTELTPTDVWLLLGFLEPGEFLSGRRNLDTAGAQSAVESLARDLGVSVPEALHAALAAINETLEQQLRSWAVDHVKPTNTSPSERWLFSYGGGGGLLAVSAATALGIDRVVVFPQSSVFSAFGGGLLPIAHSFHASVQDVTQDDTVSAALKTLLDRSSRDMRAEGVADDTEVSVTLTLYDFAGVATVVEGDLRKTFADDASTQLTLSGVARPGQLKVDLRVFDDPSLGVRDTDTFLSPTTSRSLQVGHELVEVPVAGGLGTPLADPVDGPALLAARDTTIWVPVGWTVEFDKHGYGLISRSEDHD